MGDEGDGRLAVVVTLWVKPGHEEEFLRLLAPVLDAMRHEPTFINAALHQDPADPTRFMLYETWADRTDLVEVQMKRLYRSAYEARLPELLRAAAGRSVAAAAGRLCVLRRGEALISSSRCCAAASELHSKEFCLFGPRCSIRVVGIWYIGAAPCLPPPP